MAIKPEYQSLYNQVLNMQSRLRDALGGSSDPASQNLRQQMQHLEDEVQVGKSPRDIESRIQTLQQLVQRASSSGTEMTYAHADDFHDALEDMRQAVRHLPDY